jgi:hypothetical protein
VGEVKSLKPFLADSGGGQRVKKRAFKRGNSPNRQSEVNILAKDGTNRGGARVGAGAKKKPLADKIADGNPGGRKLTIMEFSDTADLKGQAMPEPNKMLEAIQKDGKTLVASEIYKSTWTWLNERGCAALVSPQLLERYAMSVARWIQCEEAVTEYGFLAKHPTTGNAIQSPYVAMGQNYMNQTNRLWMEIFQIVKENCTGEYSGINPQDDVMERLLTARRGK